MKFKILIASLIMSFSLLINAEVIEVANVKYYTNQDIPVANTIWKVEGYPVVHSKRNTVFGDAYLHFNDLNGLVIEYEENYRPHDLKMYRFTSRNHLGELKWAFQPSTNLFYFLNIIDKDPTDHTIDIFTNENGKVELLKTLKIEQIKTIEEV